jgi:hypothetical protein
MNNNKKTIDMCNRIVRRSNLAAARSVGIIKWYHLKISAFFARVSDAGRQIIQDEQRKP